MIYKAMRHLSLYESFAEEIFNIPIFNPWTDEEDDLLFDLTYPVLDQFQGKNFIIDEPSRNYGSWDDVSDIVSSYWLVHKSISSLGMLDRNEESILREAFPDKKKSYEYKNPITGQPTIREYNSSQIFGTFYWYSIPDGEPMKPWSKRKEMFWMIGKDSMGKFRAINGPKKDLRNLWNQAKKWEDLKSLIESELPTIRDIAQYFDKHLEIEIKEWESEEMDYRSRYDYD